MAKRFACQTCVSRKRNVTSAACGSCALSNSEGLRRARRVGLGLFGFFFARNGAVWLRARLRKWRGASLLFCQFLVQGFELGQARLREVDDVDS